MRWYQRCYVITPKWFEFMFGIFCAVELNRRYWLVKTFTSNGAVYGVHIGPIELAYIPYRNRGRWDGPVWKHFTKLIGK